MDYQNINKKILEMSTYYLKLFEPQKRIYKSVRIKI